MKCVGEEKRMKKKLLAYSGLSFEIWDESIEIWLEIWDIYHVYQRLKTRDVQIRNPQSIIMSMWYYIVIDPFFDPGECPVMPRMFYVQCSTLFVLWILLVNLRISIQDVDEDKWFMVYASFGILDWVYVGKIYKKNPQCFKVTL